MIYVDDGSFTFPSHRELEIGANLVYHQFACFGLQMHIGSDSKTSKTECVFFPAPGHFKLPTLPSTTFPPNPSSSLPIFPKSLRNNYNVEARISNASAAMGALNPFWNDDAVDDYSKYLIFCAMPCNLLFWSYESFIRKVVRNTDDQIPTQLLTAWCDHLRKRGGFLQNNKKNLAQNIRLIVPCAAKDNLLSSWVYFTLDDAYWAHLVSQLGMRPSTWSDAKTNSHSTPSPTRCKELPARQHPCGTAAPPFRTRLPTSL